MLPLPGDPRTDLFLPDFCGIRVVFAVVVLGELLAIVLSLNPASATPGGFRELALISLFIQWVGLGSCALLCLGRRVLERLGNRAAAACSYLLILLVALAVSEAAWRLILPRLVSADLAPVWQFEQGASGLGAPRALITPLTHAQFLLRNAGIAAVMALLALRYFYVQHQWRARMHSESQARIQALQSRIRPHFLFNSMNTIASLARSEPALAEQVTEDLAALFRVSLGDASVPATLAQELEVCRQYLRIEAQRLGDRLRCEYYIDAAPGDAMLPALTLQPLLENAVYHGVEPAPAGGRIGLSAALDGATVRVRIENSVPPAGARPARASNAMALDNVRQRVEAYFGGAARLRIEADAEHFRVDLEFPYRTVSQ
jgi:two-component system sensor histidine kinase AlgZ